MNATRRRLAKARRNKQRLVHEMRNWSKTNWTTLPKRGRLRGPAEALGCAMLASFQHLEKLMAPVRAFAGVRHGE